MSTDAQGIGRIPVRRPSREDLEKPDWQGEEEVGRDDAPAAVTLPLLLRKACELALMATLLLPVMIYQFDVPQPWLAAVGGLHVPGTAQTLSDLAGYEENWRPFFQRGFPILEVKTTAMCLGTAILLFFFGCAKTCELLLGRGVLPALPPQSSRHDWWRMGPLLAILAFLAWSYLSFSQPMGWAPLAPPESVPKGPPEVAGYLHSLVAWCQVATGLLLFIVAEDLMRHKRLAGRILGMLLLLGWLNALTAILVQAGVPGIKDVWTKWAPEDDRNLHGAFIGHNTAISSFLMAPMFLSVALLMGWREEMGPRVRTLLSLGMILMTGALLLAQSRAVIPLLLVGTAVLLYAIGTRCGLWPSVRTWLKVMGAVIVLVATQLWNDPHNVLYRRSVSLQSRIQEFRPSRMMTETRLRILVASSQSIADHFLRGTGFGSFHYVYPKVQGDFFLAHPDSMLAPTAKRSFHAHNEYLQTLFETGIVGLSFALVGVGIIIVHGIRSMRRTLLRRDMVLQLGILAALTGLLLHAALDFPLRVAPLYTSLIMLLAIWSAGDRLWVVRAPAPQLGGNPRAAIGPFHRVAWLVANGFSLVLLVLVSRALATWFVAQTLALSADQKLQAYHVYGGGAASAQYEDYVLGAQDDLKLATILLPSDGNILMSQANADFNVALLFRQRAQGAAAAGQERLALGYANSAYQHALKSLVSINQSLAESRWNFTYQLRSLIKYFLWEASGCRNVPLLEGAYSDLDTAVRMNPGDAEQMKFLINLGEELRDARGSESARDIDRESTRVCQVLAHFHRRFFDERVWPRATELLTLGDFDRAANLLQCAVPAVSDDTGRLLLGTSAMIYGRQWKQAREWLTLAASRQPGSASILQMEAVLSLAEGKADVAYSTLDAIDSRVTEVEFQLALKAIADVNRSQPALEPNAREEAVSRLLSLAASSPGRCQTLAFLYLGIYRDANWAEYFSTLRLTMSDPPPDAQAWALLGRALELRARDDQDPNLMREVIVAAQNALAASNALTDSEHREEDLALRKWLHRLGIRNAQGHPNSSSTRPAPLRPAEELP